MIERNNKFISDPCFSTSPNSVISTTSYTMIILCLASRAIYCWFWWLVLQLIAASCTNDYPASLACYA